MRKKQQWLNARKPEKIYVKPYISEEIYDELEKSLPNDILYRFPGIPDRETLLGMVDLVCDAWKKHGTEWTIEAQFPFAFNFSIISEWVVKKDLVFTEDYNPDRKANIEYRPFFLEFKGYCKSRYDFEKMIDLVYEGGDAFFSAFFIPGDEQKDYLGYEIGEEVLAVLTGNVLFSASPIKSVGGRLVITKKNPELPPNYVKLINDDIYRCQTGVYTNARQSDLRGVLDNVFDGEIPESVTVYNVGQGYCASIIMKSGNTVFSDIGLSKNKRELGLGTVCKAKREIRRIKPSAVVLSHWDLDHILGVTNAAGDIYDAVWVVPDVFISGINGNKYPDYMSTSAKRLLKYLDWRNGDKLIRVSDRFKRELVYQNSQETISIWAGERCPINGINRKNERYTITAANNFGLMLFLENKVSALLPGDCDYIVLPKPLLRKEINYLVAPHHCSKMSQPNITPATRGKKKAILTYGLYNTFGHPNQVHMDELAQMGYEILPTPPCAKRVLTFK